MKKKPRKKNKKNISNMLCYVMLAFQWLALAFLWFLTMASVAIAGISAWQWFLKEGQVEDIQTLLKIFAYLATVLLFLGKSISLIRNIMKSYRKNK